MDRALAISHLQMAGKAFHFLAVAIEADEGSLPDAAVVAQQGGATQVGCQGQWGEPEERG